MKEHLTYKEFKMANLTYYGNNTLHLSWVWLRGSLLKYYNVKTIQDPYQEYRIVRTIGLNLNGIDVGL